MFRAEILFPLRHPPPRFRFYRRAVCSPLSLPSQAQVKLAPNPDWKDQGILNLAHSPFAKLKNIPVHAVTIQDGFWGKRREINVTNSIPSMEKLLLVNGRLDNFLRLE